MEAMLAISEAANLTARTAIIKVAAPVMLESLKFIATMSPASTSPIMTTPLR